MGRVYSSLTLLLSLAQVRTCAGHGNLLKASVRRVTNQQQTSACAFNANTAECTGDNVQMRKLIPRSGNDPPCNQPPGCVLGCPGENGSGPGGAPCANEGICDHCALEKVAAEKAIVGGDGSKWWTKMPAAHWDESDQWPVFPCMTRDDFGARGTVTAGPGDTITTTTYMNADHSGLYRFELGCGSGATNADFFANPVTPWKALHVSKELAAGDTLSTGREVGSTRAETDAYWARTVCTAAGCPYRMNGAQPQYPGGAFGITSAECQAGPNEDPNNPSPTCFIEDTFTLPTALPCTDGPATLRWMWNSAEGLETYANCLDLTIEGAAAGGGGGGGGNGGGSNQNANAGAGGSNTAIAVVIVVVLAVGAVLAYKKCPGGAPHGDKAAASGSAQAAHVSVELASASAGGAPSGGSTGLPDGWQELVDPSTGRAYYYNTTSGESRWTKP